MRWNLLNLESSPKETVKTCKRLHFEKLVKKQVCRMIISQKLIIQSTGNIITRHSCFSPASCPLHTGGASWNSEAGHPFWLCQTHGIFNAEWYESSFSLLLFILIIQLHLASTKRTHWYQSCSRNHQIQTQWLETIWLGLLILVLWQRIKTNSRWIVPI